MSTAITEKLLRSTHRAVFDHSPESELAFRLRHSGGLVWEVEDDELTVTTASPAATRTYGLLDKTLGQLVDALAADGYDVISENTALSHLGARVLVPGRGDQNTSNGDHLHAYQSLLWVLLNGYSAELGHAEYQVRQALRQMVLTQAEGEWLDLWGTLYGVPRMLAETDAALQQRIPDEVFRLRVNGIAIEDAIKAYTDEDIEIREPWRLMFTLDRSALSGIDHLHDAAYYTPHIIHPVARRPVDWAPILDVVNRNRAAGVLVYAPAVEMAPIHVPVQGPVEYLVHDGRTDMQVMGAWPGGEAPLGVMRLDDNEFSFNHLMSAFQLRTFANVEGVQTAQVFGAPRNVAWASITLSDGAPLGDENAILSRGQMRYTFDPVPTMSDSLAPSDYDVQAEIRRVERVVIDDRKDVVMVDSSSPQYMAHVDVRAMSASAYDGVNTWRGPWAPRNWLGWRDVGMTILHDAGVDVVMRQITTQLSAAGFE